MSNPWLSFQARPIRRRTTMVKTMWLRTSAREAARDSFVCRAGSGEELPGRIGVGWAVDSGCSCLATRVLLLGSCCVESRVLPSRSDKAGDRQYDARQRFSECVD